MKAYKHIIIAVDLHSKCDQTVVARGIEIAKANHAKVSLVHAVEHILNAYGIAEAYSVALDVEQELTQEAEKALRKLGKKFDIPVSEQYLEVGTPKSVILDKTESVGADLLVLGSHGRNGLQLLLGSTANSVLHHAKCDVLAVRVANH